MIGIISDTHENEIAMKKAVEIFRKRNADFVVHCGDIVSPPVLENFKGLRMKLVFGNNDGERNGLINKCKEFGFEGIKDELKFEHKGKKFYVYHGTKANILDAAIKSNKYDYILTGHTHLKRDERIGKVRVINPGALFRAFPYTVALLDVKKDKLKFEKISPQRHARASSSEALARSFT